MSYKCHFHQLAQKDYEETLLWYLEHSEKAALGFVNAVDDAIDKICNYPVRYRNTYKHFYEIGLRKYPFVIIYSIEEAIQSVVIWKIFHYRKDPKKKYSGLRSA
ncbi:MAG: type II toxin-antitoxin system RelE/ParE family toxin [Niabella sp.]